MTRLGLGLDLSSKQSGGGTPPAPTGTKLYSPNASGTLPTGTLVTDGGSVSQAAGARIFLTNYVAGRQIRFPIFYAATNPGTFPNILAVGPTNGWDLVGSQTVDYVDGNGLYSAEIAATLGSLIGFWACLGAKVQSGAGLGDFWETQQRFLVTA